MPAGKETGRVFCGKAGESGNVMENRGRFYYENENILNQNINLTMGDRSHHLDWFLNVCSEGLPPLGGTRDQLLNMQPSACNYWPFVHILTDRKYPEAIIFLERGGLRRWSVFDVRLAYILASSSPLWSSIKTNRNPWKISATSCHPSRTRGSQFPVS